MRFQQSSRTEVAPVTIWVAGLARLNKYTDDFEATNYTMSK